MALPTTAEWATLANLVDLAWWADAMESDVPNIAVFFGFTFESFKTAPPRQLSAITTADLASEIAGWTVDGTPATLRLKGVARRMHHAAASLTVAPSAASTMPQPTMDLLSAALTKLAEATSLKGSETRKVVMANVLDPADSGEIPVASAPQVKAWYQNYRARKSGDPLPDKDPTSDQAAAMHTRVVTLRQEPYADFSILTPYGRRMAKVLRCRSWLLQADGTYKPIEIPGPECFTTWEACWKVYEVILIMLEYPAADAMTDPVPVISLIALEAYYEAFAQLCRENPESWHLCLQAEDRCRAEHMPRLARRLEAKFGPPSWSDIFIAAAEDGTYWDREVRRPANSWLARGYHLVSMTTAAERAITEKALRGGGAKILDKITKPLADDDQENASRRLKKQEAKNVKKDKKLKGGKKGEGKNGSHPRKNAKGLYVTTTSGQDVCFKFAQNGVKACANPCPCKRAHVCMKCLQPHPNSECSPK